MSQLDVHSRGLELGISEEKMGKVVNVIDALPDDFTGLLEALGNRTQFEIARLLMKHGDLPLADIVTVVKGEQDVIVQHIKKLELGGVVQCYLDKQGEHYKITDFGTAICTDLIRSYNEYYAGIQKGSTS